MKRSFLLVAILSSSLYGAAEEPNEYAALLAREWFRTWKQSRQAETNFITILTAMGSADLDNPELIAAGRRKNELLQKLHALRFRIAEEVSSDLANLDYPEFYAELEKRYGTNKE